MNSSINEEKIKYNEATRSLEAFKREFYQNMDNERNRMNSVLTDSKDTILMMANDKTEKAKEDLLGRLREIEKVFRIN